MELNGKTYEMVYLTHEEKAVVDAMRLGGDVQVHMHDSTIEKAEAHMNSVPETLLPYRKKEEIGWDTTVFTMGDSFVGRVSIYHYVDIKKATDRRQAESVT